MKQMNTSNPLIRDLLDRLVAEYQPERVILFGSWATGRADQESDIDLLIIKRTDEAFIDRWMRVRKILTDRNRLTPLDTWVLTPEEFDRRIKRHDPLIEEIMLSGIELYAA